jgi:hypothetical protein
MSALNELQLATGALITVLLMVIIGAVIFDKIEAANLISTTGSFNATMTTVSSAFMVLVGLLVVIVVVVVAVVIIKAVKGMNGGGN